MRKSDSDISQGDSAARSLRRGGVAYKNEIEMLLGVERNDSADDVISNEEGDNLQSSDINSIPPIHSIHTGKMSRVSALSDFDIAGSSNTYTSKPDPPEQRKLYKQSSSLTSVDEDESERDTLSSEEELRLGNNSRMSIISSLSLNIDRNTSSSMDCIKENDYKESVDEQYESRIKEKVSRSEMKRSINSTSTSSSNSSNDKFEDRLRAKMKGDNRPSSTYTSSRSKHSINSSSSTATSNDKFESRLRAKMKGDSKPSSASSSFSNDKFDGKVNAKMIKQNDGKEGLSTSPDASEGFESRLRAKLEDGNTTSSASTTSSNPNDRFEGRLREKMRTSDNSASIILQNSISNTTKADTSRDTPSDTLQSKNSSVSYDSGANGNFENRLRAKLKDGNKKQSSLPVESSTPSPSLSEDVETKQSEEEAIETYAYIPECSEERRFNDILKCMENNPSLSSSIVSQAIDKLNDSLVLSHDIINSNVDSAAEIARLNEHWVEILASNMSNHNTNEMIQLSALRTIWLIVSLDSKYALELTTYNDGLNALFISMKNHQQSKPIQLCGTGIIAHLSSIKQGASLLLSFDSDALIERLGGALSIGSHFSLEALFNLLMLSLESKSSRQFDSIIKTIAQCTEFQHQGNNKSMNAIETVLGIMTHCAEHVTLQIWGCRLLGAILSLNDCLLNPSNEKLLLAIISSILHHLEVIMTKYTPPLLLYESIICLLSAISCCSDNILAGREESISQLAVATMIAEPTSHTVALYGCHCLNNVLHRQDETSGVLLRAITNFDDNLLVEMALNTLARLTKGAFQYCISLLNNEVELIQTIVECMIKYQNEPSIQSPACDLLSALALDREVTLRICSTGGANRIITTLYSHRNEPSVVSKAFAALSNISGTVKASIMQESQAPRCILSTMEANETDLTIQTQAVNALWALGSMNSRLKEEIIQQNGLQLISKAMTSYIACQQLQEKGIIALWTLASTSSVASSPELVKCVTEPITDAISAHIMCQQVCQHSLGALSSITCPKTIDDDNRLIDLIIGCMWMHAEVASIQQGALGALSKASIEKSTNVVIQITSQDIDAITNAMRMHVTTKDVQENAVILLQSLTLCHDNVIVISQNPWLQPLILTAKLNFPQLRVNVDDLLLLLPAQ